MTDPTGAYGVALPAQAHLGTLLPVVSRSAPEWIVDVAPAGDGPKRPPHHEIDEDRAVLAIGRDDSLVCDRENRKATFFMSPEPSDSLLVHPLLAAIAGIAAHWRGALPLHAGAFIADDGAAWVVLADREHGKSTTMAELAMGGVGVLCDDMAVLEGGAVHAGPRCVDLRPSSADRYAEAEYLGVIGERERVRLRTGPCPPSAPLGGFVRLAWADETRLSPTPVLARFSMLGGAYALSVPPGDRGAFVGLAERPCFDLVRPKELSSMDETIELLRGLSG